MPDQVQRALHLLARLHGAMATSPARRRSDLEHLLEPLGNLLGATAVLLLVGDGGRPLLVRSRCGMERARPDTPHRSRCASGAWAGTWWVRWMEPFGALPADGCVRRGRLLPHGPCVVARPAGWGPSRRPRSALARRGGRPVLAIGLRLGRSTVRLILLREPGQAAFSAQDGQLLDALSEQLRIHDDNVRLLDRLRRASVTDDLTQIYNYRYLKRTLHGALQTLRRRGGSFSVLMVDVDNLREYNNRFGHLAASRVLAEIGEVLRRAVGSRGWVAKYGGDEFLIVLPSLERLAAHAVAERLRLAVQDARIGVASFGGITCSFGVATASQDGDTYVCLLEAADRALFRAKAAGRNQVVDAAGPETGEEGLAA